MIGIKVLKKYANNLRVKIIEENLLCKTYKVSSDDNYVYLPLTEDYDEKIVEKISKDIPFDIIEYDFVKAQYRPVNFMDYLEDKISKEEAENIVKSFDIIGDIVILEIPEELTDKKTVIGEAVLKFTKRRSVYCKKSSIKGVTRTRDLEYLAGVDDLETIHKEYGIRFKLNPSTVYFSPRLATERSRIVEQVNDNEVIIDFFAGIGSFPISIAHVKKVKVYSVDINPEAYYYVNENIKLNRLVGEVIPIEGDIRKVISKLPMANRILMNLPGTAKDFLDIAVHHLKEGGVLNYYEFSSDYETVLKRVKKISYPRECEVLNVRKVKSQSPGVWHIGLDVKIY